MDKKTIKALLIEAKRDLKFFTEAFEKDDNFEDLRELEHQKDAQLMEKEGKEWTYEPDSGWAWRKGPEGTTWSYSGNGIWTWKEKINVQ